MRKIGIIFGSILGIVIAFLALTNPTSDQLKTELPGIESLSNNQMENCISIGRIENWFLLSKFKVAMNCHGYSWTKYYRGVAGNFYEITPESEPNNFIPKEIAPRADSTRVADSTAWANSQAR